MSWTWTIEEHPASAESPTPEESFRAMDRASRSSEHATRVSSGGHCKKAYLKVTATDPSGKTLAGCTVTLSFAGGAGQRKETNAQGIAEFPDVDKPASELSVVVTIESEDEQGVPTYALEVVDREPPPEPEPTAKTEDAVEEVPYYARIDRSGLEARRDWG